jgi:short subunit dehydrogenase-like uncharacterized protein
MKGNREHDVVLFGATGFTGHACVVDQKGERCA